MNTRAYIYEGLVFDAADSQPVSKNGIWKYISEKVVRLRGRFISARRLRRDRVVLGQTIN